MPRITIPYGFELEQEGSDITTEFVLTLDCTISEDDDSVGFKGGLSDFTVDSCDPPWPDGPSALESWLTANRLADIDERACIALSEDSPDDRD